MCVYIYIYIYAFRCLYTHPNRQVWAPTCLDRNA